MKDLSSAIGISERLKAIASFLPTGTYFADIGSDHAYLPCYVCLQDDIARAIAGEVNIGPYRSAIKNVKDHELSDRIDVRLGDGLTVIGDDPITEVVIAGMGGALIADILESGKRHLHSVKQVIAQPNITSHIVREWFIQNHFYIVDEYILEENNHIYEIIIAENSNDTHETHQTLTPQQILFGPFLLEKKSEVFLKKWHHEKQNYERILIQMNKASHPNKEKIMDFKKELSWIKEVLSDGKAN